MTTERIAKKYRVCAASLTLWAKRAGLSLRQRGRRSMTEPTSRQRAIIEMAGIINYSAVGSAFGMTKQGVSRIIRRWKRPGEPSRESASDPAQGEEPPVNAANVLTEADLTGDIERVIAKAVRPYVDDSNPMLHFDELKAECLAKLAKILHHGCLAKCPTRAKVFAFLKTSFRNHVRSLVQKHAFTAKRTGCEPTRTSSGAEPVELRSRKPCHISLSNTDQALQLGREDDSFRRREFLEELRSMLTVEEDEVLDYLLNEQFCVAGSIVDADALRHLPNKRLPIAFVRARASIRRKCRAILMPGNELSLEADEQKSLASGESCTVADTKYGHTKRHTGTEIRFQIGGRPARLQQRADDNAPTAPGGSDRGRCDGHVVQGIGSPDPGRRIGRGRGASDGSGNATKEQSLAAKPGSPSSQTMCSSASKTLPAWRPRECVVSFRISKEQAVALERFMLEGPIVGVSSINKLARKVALDFVEGRLHYDDPHDGEVDWGIYICRGGKAE